MSAANINPNNRASLLAGLRTGGVRSASLNVPHTAAPGGAFNVAPFPSINVYSEDEEGDQIGEMPQRSIFNNRNIPITAAVDGPNNRFSAQQQATSLGMNPHNAPFTPSHMLPNPQMQMQMIQLEMIRQAMQAQQMQAEMIAQAQLQQQAAQARERRSSLGFNPPATAGPTTNSFNSGSAAHGQMRRPNQAELLRAQLGIGSPSGDHVPMTAEIGGRFGSRSASANVLSEYPATPGSTTVISGGTSLGNLSPSSVHAATPSKSDAVSSWRRAGNNSVLTPNRVVSSPGNRASPRPAEGHRVSPPPGSGATNTHFGIKFRPQPLRFSPAVSQPLPTVAVDTTDDETDSNSSGSSVKSIGSKSSPTTPRSTSSHDMPLSPREEASKKLFEGLGISRPISATPSDQGQQQQQQPVITISNFSNSPPAPGHRLVSQPTRQPRGPPSGADELGPKNFATRIRRKAIGGLGMLIGARDRREVVEAF